MVLQYLSINNFDLTKKWKIRKKISLKKFVKIQRFCGICLFNNFHLTKKKKKPGKIPWKKLVKLQRFCSICLLTTLIWRKILRKFFVKENSWKHNGFAVFLCLPLRFDEYFSIFQMCIVVTEPTYFPPNSYRPQISEKSFHVPETETFSTPI